ncbi:MAG: hypothetical protein WDN25_31165 [Acetobacteraceae bacterium]
MLWQDASPFGRLFTAAGMAAEDVADDRNPYPPATDEHELWWARWSERMRQALDDGA